METLESNRKEDIVPLFLRGTQLGSIFSISLCFYIQCFELILIWLIWIVVAEILILYLKQ